jgi:hypothetical protein
VDDGLQDGAQVDLKKLSRLCVPVDTNGKGITNPTRALTCYGVAPARGTPRFAPVTGLHVQTRFGPERLDTRKVDQLCVPSTVLPAGD